MKYSNNEWVLVGKIRVPHGIRGEVVVDSYTDFPQRLAKESLLYLSIPGSDPQPVRIERSRPHKKGWIIQFDRAHTRSEADSMRGCDLLLPEALQQQLPPGLYYPHHLIGCQVVTRSQKPLGKVKGVLFMETNPLLQVEGPHGEILIPMVESIVVAVDLSLRRLTVDLPAGLIELNT